MTPERYKRIEEVFGLAIERRGENRARLLVELCGDDAELRREVEALLVEHERVGSFLAEPALPTKVVAEALARPRVLEAGAVIDEKYRVEALLGRGGMGEVYRATQLSLQRTVALKVVRSDLAASAVMLSQFRREAHAIARLRHPNIVTIHEYGVESRVGAYFVMEHLEGRSLRVELEQRERLPSEVAVALMRQVCDAVSAAHGAGIVHRDLKPDNIFLEEGSGGTRVKVLDFGIAKLAEGVGRATGDLSAGGAGLGTPAYMAPEQATGDEVDGRADIYALGCVLYELVTGSPPFTAATSAGITKLHLSSLPRPPREHTPDVPEQLETAILRSLSKDPSERFQTVEDFLSALDASVAADVAALGEGTLPTFVGGFVGRRSEVAAVASLLSEGRLVTLVGPGGMGKTRLAVEAAASSRKRYAHGAWLVELASLTDPRLVSAAVASVLGIREEGGEPLAATLQRALRGRNLLVVLDNCEHLVDACARFSTDLLHACPRVSILATSREALGVEGEARYEVAPLGLPGRLNAPCVDEIADCESVQLFVERAQSARPEFSLSERNAPGVAEICRRLDGIPLAIELAAARVRALAVDQILERLRDRFRLLVGGDRAVLPRHQTLRAAIDWGYDLLSDQERALLARLSVFAGGWDLEAAESVCASGPVERDDVVDLMTRLVDTSLVTADSRDGGARYGMLETIRQYAWERLSATGEAPAALAAHTEWFAALAERARSHWQGPEEASWAGRLAIDYDNLRLVLSRETGEGGDPQVSARICGALTHFWIRRGHIVEGRRWLDAALESATVLAEPERAEAITSAGRLAAYDGDLATARVRLDESASIYRALGDGDGLCRVLGSLANVFVSAGEYERAAELATESLSLARELGDWQRMSSALVSSGILALAVSRYADAERLLLERLAICRDHESRVDLVTTLLLLSGCVGRLGRLDEAEALLNECEAVARSDGFEVKLAYAHGQRGLYALWRGDAERAVELLEESLARFWELEYRSGVSAALDDLSWALAAGGRHEEAIRLAGTAAVLREEMGVAITPQASADLDFYLGPARRALGDEVAARLFAEGRATALDVAVARCLRRRPAHRP